MLFRKSALRGQENSTLQKYLLMQFPSEKNNCWLYGWTEIPALWFEQQEFFFVSYPFIVHFFLSYNPTMIFWIIPGYISPISLL